MRIGLALLALLAACGPGDDSPCSTVDNSGCPTGQACEAILNGASACVPPVFLTGKVTDSVTGMGVEGARVVAIGAGGAAISRAASTTSDGSFAIQVPAPRNASYRPLTGKVSVAVNALGFANFPSRWRAAAVVDLIDAAVVAGADRFTVSGPGSQIALTPFGGGQGRGVISGTAPLPALPGPVVVAAAPINATEPVTTWSVVDAVGQYQLVGLPPGRYEVNAYAKGLAALPVPIGLNTAENTVIDIINGTATSTVSGTATSSTGAPNIALAVAGTLDPNTGEAVLPVGLSARIEGGRFTITGVPAGRYVVLPSPENDDLNPLDPLTTIEVKPGVDLSVEPLQRIGGAVPILGPGPNGAQQVASPPTLSWVDVANEARYRVVVVNSLGIPVWQKDVAGTDSTSILYGGPFLPGSFYRFQVQALDMQGAVFMRSEDLRGIFYPQVGP